jgi:hypothetical protein
LSLLLNAINTGNLVQNITEQQNNILLINVFGLLHRTISAINNKEVGKVFARELEII